MKKKLEQFSVYAVILPLIIAGTLLVLFGAALLERIVYPVFRKVAYMNVREPEYRIPIEEEPSVELSDEEIEEARAEVVDEYKMLYGSKYEDHLKEDIQAAREELGDAAYERVWGNILEDFEKGEE